MESSSANGTSTDCCIVCSLLSKQFSSYTFMEKLEIMTKSRPKPPLKKLTTKIKTCTRYFNVELYEQHEWLTGCDALLKLFCWPCLLFTDEKSIWTKTGFSDLNNVHKLAKRHSISRIHLQAVIKEKVFGKSRGVVDKQLKISYRYHNESVEKNRAVLKRLIDIVLFLGVHEIGFRGHDESDTSTNNGNYVDLISVLSKYDSVLMNHLEQTNTFKGTSNHIQNDLILAIGTVVSEKIKSEIRQARFVAVFLDETDIGNMSQLSVVLRYLTADGIQERFLGFIDISADRTAESLSNICDIIENFDCSDKLVAQSYDGAAVITGQLRKLEAKIRETFPNALLIHCFAHHLNLILSQSVTHIKECKIFFSILSGLAEFFSKSDKRRHALDAIVKKRLPEVAPIQWNCSERLVQTVNECQLPLIELFENILEKSCDWDSETLNSSKGFLEYLKKDFNFKFLLNIFSEIFPFCNSVCTTLQHKLNDVESCVEKVEELKNFINKKRNDFDDIWEKLIEMDFEPPEKRARTDAVGDLKTTYHRLWSKILDQLYKETNSRFNNIKNLKFIELCNFGDFQNKSFPEAAFQSLAKHYADCFDMLALRAELTVIYVTEDTNVNTNASDLLNFLKETGLDKAYLEVLKLCELVMIIPAFVERSCVMKRIKNFVKNSTEDKPSDLALLSIEKDLVKEMSEHPRFYDDVIEEFSKKGGIELHYK